MHESARTRQPRRTLGLAPLAILGLIGWMLPGCPTVAPGNGGGNDGPTEPTYPDCPTSTPAPETVDLELLFETGDPVPGLSNARFTFFGTPIIDGVGRVAFWAGFSGRTGQGDAGLFVWEGGTLTTVVTDDPSETGVVPGRDTADYFGDIEMTAAGGDPPMAWGSDGRLIFVSPIAGEEASRGIFRYRMSDGDLLNVVQLEQQAEEYDDAREGALSAEFFQPGVSDGGVVPYVVQYTYITLGNSFVTGRRALFTSNGRDLTRIADANPDRDLSEDVPDQAGAFFTSIGRFSTLNPAGAVLFQAEYGGVDDGGNAGVYVHVNGRTVRAVDNRPGAGFDGLPVGSTVNENANTFAAITIGAGLRMAIDTTLTTSTATRDTVIYWNGVDWEELEGRDEFASALLSGMSDCGAVLFLADGLPFIFREGAPLDLTDDAGSAFRGEVTWSNSPGAMNNQTRALLRYARGDQNTPGLALWTGAEFIPIVDDTDGLLQDIDAVSIPERVEQDRPGRSGALNDADELTFRVADAGNDGELRTADDVQGLYFGVGE